MTIHIELPFPPTVNSYYGLTKRGIKYITKKGKEFRKDVCQACLEQNVFGLSLDYRLQFDVILYPPDRRTRDLDNYMKALQDALGNPKDGNGAKVWVDDSQIDDLHPQRGVILTGGKCSVRIQEHNGFILPDNPDVWDFID